MKFVKLIAVTALLFAISFPCMADAQNARAGAFTISPIFGGFYWDGDAHVGGNGPEYGIGVGYNFTERFGTELMFNLADPGTDGKLDKDGDVDLFLMHVDAVYHVRKGWILDPYIAAGAGVGLVETWQGGTAPHLYHHRASINYGGGIEYFVSDNLALRGDLRHVIVFDDHTLSNFMYTAGLTYYIGR